MKICFATNNANKLKEVRALLDPQFEVLSLKDIGCTYDLPENQETLEGNSLEKSRFVFDNFQIDCFADDTGLEVKYLSGAPGVYSARYAGPHKSNEDNITLLLQKLEKAEDRSAQFRTVFTLIIKGQVFQFEGVVKGKIISQKIGNQGFGYDPVFVPLGYEQTFAEMSMTEKGKISHRGIATRKLVDFLQKNINKEA